MTLAIIPPASIVDTPSNQQNPAVARCREAWDTAYQTHALKCKSESACGRVAKKAFLHAMPQLSGYQNICDYIACVGYAMTNSILYLDSGGKLLYAAQVALSTVSKKPKT